MLLAAALAAISGVGEAQDPDATTVLDSVAVLGARRVPEAQIRTLARIAVGREVTYRDVQRAIEALFDSGEFDDVRVTQGVVDGKQILRIEVIERPTLASWTVRGAEKVAERTVRGKIRLREGRPYDRAVAHRSLGGIDSLYRKAGYYLATPRLREIPGEDGTVRVVFDIDEGRRVAIARVVIEGNEAITDEAIVGRMKTDPEGFWWFQRGEFDDVELERDVRERLPTLYASRGYIDFHVVDDTLIVHEETGKGTLVLTVDEGNQYQVGRFEVIGNRQFSTEQIEALYPFGDRATGFFGLGGRPEGPAAFDDTKWLEATQAVQSLYGNAGYLYADVRPVVARTSSEGGTSVVDLRWQITEGSPATINRVDIVGNAVTHESVIRRAIVLVPGDVFRQDAMIQSYRNVSNLGFFQQPLAIPQIQPTANRVDVDVVFRVEERRTGNVNFGASVGQGTGLGGFIGLDEPNVLGRGKRVAFQWQFGRNISDFNITYGDPAIRGGLISGSLTLHNTRLRYTVADLGRIRTRGGSFQLGFPLFGSRFTRLLTSYTFEESDYDSPTLSSQFFCRNCILSMLGLSVVRDTRFDLPFATGGAMHQVQLSQGGGPLGGSGSFRRATFEGRWYAPLGSLGGVDALGSGSLRFVLGLTGKAGFVWGDPGPHFRQLFTLGGTQFGVPLRGYDEFSITPDGFDASASGFRANTVDAFGRSYFAVTGEIGVRVSQALYFSTFFDAGNVWARPAQFNPTRLFRGAGLGVSVLSPLGPLGLDYAYGFDRTDAEGDPAPRWKFHFKLGNFF